MSGGVPSIPRTVIITSSDSSHISNVTTQGGDAATGPQLASNALSGPGLPRTYQSSLHALCNDGPRRHGNWDRVVSYLERHCTVASSAVTFLSSAVAAGAGLPGPGAVGEFNPLDPNLCPGDGLREAATRRDGPAGDETALHVAVRRRAPARVVAALCQLFPDLAAAADSEGRTALHLAAMRPTGGAQQQTGGDAAHGSTIPPGQDSHNVLRVLVSSHPPGLVGRDGRGLTPLHILFANHPESRGVVTVEVMCGDVNPEVIKEVARKHDTSRSTDMEELDGGLLLGPVPVPSAGAGRRRGLGGIASFSFPISEGGGVEDDDKTRRNEGIEVETVVGNPTLVPRAVSSPRKLRRLPRLPRIPTPTLTATPAFSDNASNAVSPNAAIVPDSVHGCLPLHYAVMNGATVQAIRYLLGKYPAAIRTGDRYGRTALGWYLGGSEWEAEEREQEVERETAAPLSPSASAADGGNADLDDFGADLRRTICVERVRLMRSVFGVLPESDRPQSSGDGWSVSSGISHSHSNLGTKRKTAEDAIAAANTMLHRNRRSSAMISLLLNQNVANAADGRRRLPLHFAARLLAMSLIDPPEDRNGVDEVSTLNGSVAFSASPTKASAVEKTSVGCIAFKAIKLIVDSNRSALAAPDIYGRTPLHVLFVTAHTWNRKEYHSLIKNERLYGRYIDAPGRGKGPGAGPFRPPSALVKLLLQRAMGSPTVTPATPTAGRMPKMPWTMEVVREGDVRTNDVSPRTPPKLHRPEYLDDDDYFDGEVSDESRNSDAGSDYEDNYERIKYDAGTSLTDDDVTQTSSSTGAGGASTVTLPLSSMSLRDDSVCATFVEDRWGLLPIHYAVVTVAPPKVLRALIENHPLSVLHVTHGANDLWNENDTRAGTGATARSVRSPGKALKGLCRTPFHMAFSSPYTAPLHTAKTLAPLMEKPQAVSDPDKGQGSLPSPFHPRKNLDGATAEAKAVVTDGNLALKMEDATGKFPLHLAAEHGASLSVLRLLLNKYGAAALAQSHKGNLPVHLLLDSNPFVNIEVLELAAELEAVGTPSPRASNRSVAKNGESVHVLRARQTKVRATAAQAARLSRTGVGNAIFGQMHGWTSDDDEEFHSQNRRQVMLKFDLLLRPLLRHPPSLMVQDSRHGMTVLHIAVAFHAAGYESIHTMLMTCPGTAKLRSKGSGDNEHSYTPLDLHLLRQRFPGEVSADEMRVWQAIREILFSYELYPLGSAVEGGTNLSFYRRDRDWLMRCVRVVRAEARQGRWSTHRGPGFTFDPLHIDLGLVTSHDIDGAIEEEGEKEETSFKATVSAYHPENSKARKKGEHDEFHLSDVASRLWSFLATFINQSDPNDHYAPYVEAVISDLDFPTVQSLMTLPLPDCCASERTSTPHNLTGLTILDCANVNCKAVLNATFYFAGLYDFAPPPPSSLGDGGSGSKGDRHDRTGGGSSTRGPSILLHRGADEQTLILRAIEHRFTTAGDADAEEEEEKGKVSNVGGIEVSKFDGEAAMADTSTHNRLVSNFRVTSRSVCVKFIRDRQSYDREVQLRMQLCAVIGKNANAEEAGSMVVPILNNFDATGGRPIDQRYLCHLQDPRFRLLPLYQCSATCSLSIDVFGGRKKETVDISQYPYAIVLPLMTELNLGSTFRQGRIDDVENIKDITLQIGQALNFMHTKNIIHCNISMGNTVGFPLQKDRSMQWMLTDLTRSYQINFTDDEDQLSTHLGEISPTGVAYYSSGSLPPEMFMQLNATELSMYEEYWDTVMKMDNITIESDHIDPWVDPTSGDVYVVKCYCSIKTNPEKYECLPPLPYELIPPTQAVDLWSFGVLLFTLCSGGHSLFPTNHRTGNLSSFEGVGKWTADVSKQVICDQIKDPIAQDILFHLLAPEKERSSLKVETILCHPFFVKERDLSNQTRQMLQKVTEQRLLESQKRKEKLKKGFNENPKKTWYEECTVTLDHPSLDLRMKMMHSTTELTKVVFNASDQAPVMPFSFIILPYKLARNKSGKLTPSTKTEVGLCERLGKLVLNLSKASVFVHAIELGLKKDYNSQKRMVLWADSKDSPESISKDILLYLCLDSTFLGLSFAYASLIRAGKEFFLSDPIYMARKLIHNVTKELLDVFNDSGKAFLYMVDEYSGIPVVPPPDEVCCYPQVITKNVSKVVLKAYPFMHMCILHAQGVAGDISGLVKLIFEGAYPHIPPSWTTATTGLAHYLDREKMGNEVRMLRVSLEEMVTGKPCGNLATSCNDNELYAIEAYFLNFDPDKIFSNLCRVTDGEGSLWVTKPNIKHIEKECDSKNVIEAYYAQEAFKAELREKDARIVELERALRAMLSHELDEKKAQG